MPQAPSDAGDPVALEVGRHTTPSNSMEDMPLGLPDSEVDLLFPSSSRMRNSADRFFMEPASKAMEDVYLSPPEGSEPDVVLTSGPRARRTSAPHLPSILAAIEQAHAVGELQAVLQSPTANTAAGEHAESVERSMRYVVGLVRKGECALCAWPVISCNEWGMQQERVLVLTSQCLYRVAFLAQNGSIDHYSRTSLGAIKRIERGRQAFRLCVTEPDGRENPLTYFWTEYIQKGAPRDNRFERVYYPAPPFVLPLDLTMAVIIGAIKAANRLLCVKVGEFLPVAELEVVDYQPEGGVVEEVIDSTARGIESLSRSLVGVWNATFAPKRDSGMASSSRHVGR